MAPLTLPHSVPLSLGQGAGLASHWTLLTAPHWGNPREERVSVKPHKHPLGRESGAPRLFCQERDGHSCQPIGTTWWEIWVMLAHLPHWGRGMISAPFGPCESEKAGPLFHCCLAGCRQVSSRNIFCSVKAPFRWSSARGTGFGRSSLPFGAFSLQPSPALCLDTPKTEKRQEAHCHVPSQSLFHLQSLPMICGVMTRVPLL